MVFAAYPRPVLVATEAPDFNATVFERWCQTQVHLKSGIRRTQMHIIRNLCLYRRRDEPACFVPDPALFPANHQYLTPYRLSDAEIAQLLAAVDTLIITARFPLRNRAVRLGIVLLYTAGVNYNN